MRIAVLLLLLSAFVRAQQQPNLYPTQPPSPPPIEPAAAEGKVINAATGEPVPRALVTLRPIREGPGPQDPAPGFAMDTDDAGTFHFARQRPGRYDLLASKPGYLKSSYGARRAGGPGIPVVVVPGATAGDLDIKLAPQAVVTGAVTNDRGDPVAGCRVQLTKRGWIRGKPGLLPGSSAYVDDTGAYRLAGIGPGRYIVRADCSDNMGPTPQLVDRDGNHVRLHLVSTYYGDTANLETASSLQVQSGQELTGINIRLRLEPVYRVAGRLVSLPENDAPTNYFIALLPQNTLSYFLFNTFTHPRPNGTFEFTNIQPGSYNIFISRVAGRNGRVAAHVDVAAADVPNLEISLPSPVDLSGRLRIEGDQPKAPLSSVQLMLQDDSGMAAGTSIPANDGSFKFEGMALDRYQLNVMFPGQAFYVKSVRVGEREMQGTTVDVTHGPALIDLVLSTNPGKVEGTVNRLDPDTRQPVPAPAINVVLIPEVRTAEFNSGLKFASSGKDGRFHFTSLEPGNYKAFAADGLDWEQWTNPELAAAFDSLAVPVEVAEHENKHITLTLITAEQASQVLDRLGL